MIKIKVNKDIVTISGHAEYDDSGKDIRNNINKTTGIKYLVQGVADAYKKQEQLVDFKFVISNH